MEVLELRGAEAEDWELTNTGVVVEVVDERFDDGVVDEDDDDEVEGV